MNTSIWQSQRILILNGLMFVLLAMPAMATVIMIYPRDGVKASMQDMKSIATIVRQNLGNPVSLQTLFPGDKFGYAISENSTVIPREFSVMPGFSAYFWSDGPVKMDKGFEARGGPVAFESGTSKVEGVRLQEGGIQKVKVLPKISSMQAALKGRSLRLNYILSKPGPVSLQVFEMSGRPLGKWNWTEGMAGIHAKTINIEGLPKNSVLLVRWTNENLHSVQKILGEAD